MPLSGTPQDMANAACEAVAALLEMAVPDRVIDKYQRCTVRILKLFDNDPWPKNYLAHELPDRLEALLDIGLLGPTVKADKPSDDGGICPDCGAPSCGHMVDAMARQHRTITRVRLLTQELCSCGGRGPDDKGACDACVIYHATK